MSSQIATATVESHFEVPCDSRSADGFFRGSMIGFAWSLYFPIHPGTTSNRIIDVACSRTLGAVKAGGLFGGFMATYSYISCRSKVIRGKRDHMNGLIAGCLTGMLWSVPSNNPRLMLTTGLLCGLMGSAVEFSQER
ncbi:hypothetical protein BSKO_01527 [Bryopsis sp. KO-2023]|nr:hypothetical protein BSKO_01527 [Bryopsis sp. KO-2023]